MDLYGRCLIVDSTCPKKAARSGSRVLSRNQITERWSKISLEQPIVSLPRDLIPLWVTRNEEPQEELHVSDSSQSKISAQKTQEISGKIRAALNLLAFRDKHVLIQFWSACDTGKHKLLTLDQPFGLGSLVEELFIYRKDSERKSFLVDKDHPEDDISPPARVFRHGLPEWTSDLTNYRPKDFAQQDCAVRCNLLGYLALPVFDSTTQLCVGVLELLMSSKETSYASEVQQIYNALKKTNLTSPQVFGSTAPEVPNQHREDQLNIISDILKSACDKHKLPLAQTWAESAFTSFISHDKMIERSCSSFDISCFRKVCMSTAFLPFYVQDLRMWSFREACKEQHLDKYRSFVGKALLARGSNYCDDITLLSEEEYPLVHNARTSGLGSCFAISLHGEGDTNYVLEFFLPLDSKDSSQVLNLVQTIELNIADASSEFVLGKIALIQIAVPATDATYLSSSLKPQAIGISSQIPNTLASGMDTWEPEPETGSGSGTGTETESESESESESEPSINMVASTKKDNATSYPILMRQNMSVVHAGETSKPLKRERECKMDSLTVDAIEHKENKKVKLPRALELADLHNLSQEGPSQQKASKVMVKAFFKDDMIKFQFPTSSGFLELKNEVAQRLHFKGELNIKYKDEDDALIVITCKNDFDNILGFHSANLYTTLKLSISVIGNGIL